MAGRTHGQQAVPITLGAKLATFLWQCLRVRRISWRCGPRPVGSACTARPAPRPASAPTPSKSRADTAERLGLVVGDGPWHVARDGIAAFGAVCARAGGDLRPHWRARSSTSREPRSRRSPNRPGHHRGASSTMPQKANPIDSETIVWHGRHGDRDVELALSRHGGWT